MPRPTSAQIFAAAVLELASIIAVTLLALAGHISGQVAAALIAPHLALRAVAAIRRPPPGGGTPAVDLQPEPEPPSQRRRPRRAPLRLAEVGARLVEGIAVALGGLVVLELLHERTASDAPARAVPAPPHPHVFAQVAAVGALVLGLAGCAEFWSALAASGPIAAAAGQAASGYAAAVASARASGQLPAADPRVDELEARLRALEAAETADAARCAQPDAGAAPVDAQTVAELLEREAAARAVAAEERRAIAAELRALVRSALPPPPTSGPAPSDAGVYDASGDGGQ